MVTTLYVLLWIAVFAFGVLCAAKLVLSLFSDSVWRSVRRRPLLHILGVSLALAPFILIYIPYWWPPVSLERGRQRNLVHAVIQTNGGWGAFQMEAARLIQFAATNDQYQWSPKRARFSPERRLPRGFPLLTVLNPQEVEVRPYTFQGHEKAVFVKVYGMHSTGGRGIPFYGLLYAPVPLTSPKEPVGLDALVREQIVPSVYELHR